MEEKRNMAGASLLRSQDQLIEKDMEKRKWMPKEGDWVLLRNYALDKQRGQKLLPRWDGPFIVERITISENSMVLRSPVSFQTKGRYSVDSLKPYLRREDMDDSWGEGVEGKEVRKFRVEGINLQEYFEGQGWKSMVDE